MAVKKESPKKTKKSTKEELFAPDKHEAMQKAELLFEPLRLSSFQNILSRLKILSKNPPQVILFEGGSKELRMAIAKHWACLYNCLHSSTPCYSCVPCLEIANDISPDFLLFNGLEGSIKIDEMRAIKPLVANAPAELKHRIVLFYEANSFTVEAANSLLKILEEPNNTTSFIFTVSQREKLLQTLVSRSTVLSLPTSIHKVFNEEEIEIIKSLHMFFTSGKNWFSNYTSKKTFDKEEAQKVLYLLTAHISKALYVSQNQEDSALTEYFKSKISIEKSFAFNDFINDAQQALVEMVNPAIVVDTLLTQAFILLNAKQEN